MATASNSKSSKVLFIVGCIISGLMILALGAGIVFSFLKPEMLNKEMDHLGYPANAAMPIVIAEACSVILYAIPRTAMLGAILITGYIGGAIASHVRAGEAFIAPAIFGVLPWLGLYLRDPRVRRLIPLR
jgi:hypothetical protein